MPSARRRAVPRLVIAVLIAAAAMLAAAGSARALTTFLDFESGPPIGQPIENQYAASAFVYWQREDPGFRPYRRTAGVATHSGSTAADVGPDHCYPGEEDNPVSCEFVTPGTLARLTHLASGITLYAGLFSASSGGSVSARLTALDSSGTPVATSTVPITVGITTPVTVTRPTADIASFELAPVGPGEVGAQLGFDDLTLQFPDETTPAGCPVGPQDSASEDRVTSPDELDARLRAPFTGRIVVPRDVRWEMRDCKGNPLQNMPVDSNVSVVGERGALGSRPVLYTQDREGPSYNLFKIDGNNASIRGLQLRGPFRASDRRNKEILRAAAIAVSINPFPEARTGLRIEITGNDIARFTNAVAVHGAIQQDRPEDYHAACPPLARCPHLSPDDARSVRVAGNYLHHNMMYGGGYGVVVGGGAYATAVGNTFEFNYHSMAASGRAYSGYVARFNYALHGSLRIKAYPHHFDVHGRGRADQNNYAGGPAGTYFLVDNNTFRGEQRRTAFHETRAVFKLRGLPARGAFFRNNVMVQDDFDEAVKFSAGDDPRLDPDRPSTFNFDHSGNRYDVDYTTEIAGGDFDADGRTDVFVANGTGWFYSRAGIQPWEFLDGRRLRTHELAFADVDNDGIDDVIFRRENDKLAYVKRGSSPAVALPFSPVRAKDLRFGDFDGDGLTDIFYTRNGKWHVWYGSTRVWTRTATSGAPLSGLLFGEFDAVRGTDVAAVANGAWSYSSGASSRWARLNAKLRDSFSRADAADFNGDGATDIAFLNGRKWVYSPGGRQPLRVLREGREPVGPLAVGHFVPVGGSLARAQVVSWTQPPAPGRLGFRLQIWRGQGTGDAFTQLSPQNMR